MKHSCFPQLCLPGGRSLVQELGRSLTSQPGEISNNAPSILGLPAVRIVGECLLTSDAPDLTTPPPIPPPLPKGRPYKASECSRGRRRAKRRRPQRGFQQVFSGSMAPRLYFALDAYAPVDTLLRTHQAAHMRGSRALWQVAGESSQSLADRQLPPLR